MNFREFLNESSEYTWDNATLFDGVYSKYVRLTPGISAKGKNYPMDRFISPYITNIEANDNILSISTKLKKDNFNFKNDKEASNAATYLQNILDKKLYEKFKNNKVISVNFGENDMEFTYEAEITGEKVKVKSINDLKKDIGLIRVSYVDEKYPGLTLKSTQTFIGTASKKFGLNCSDIDYEKFLEILEKFE